MGEYYAAVLKYAARAGTTSARYWGESSTPACGFANVYDATSTRVKGYGWRAHACDDGHGQTAPVGSFRPNRFGLYDVLGNVGEWTGDCWNGSYRGAPSGGEVWERGECGRRVLRGGSWYYSPGNLRAASRGRVVTGDRYYDYGFRLARTGS